MRSALRAGRTNVKVDVFGFADWMPRLTNRPDAYIASPPDERMGFNWSTDPNFSFNVNRTRMKEVMKDDVNTFGTVIYIGPEAKAANMHICDSQRQ